MPPAAKSSKHALKKPKVLEATCLADVGATLQAIEEDVKRHQASIQQQLQKSTLAMMTSSSSSPQQSTSNNNNTTTANGGSPSANGAATGLSSSPQSVPRRSSMAHGDGITNTDNHASPSTTLLMKAGGSAATQEARKALKKQLVATAAKRLGVQRTRGESVAADPNDNNTTDHSLYAEADDETGEGEEDPQQQDVLKKIAHLPVFARVHADAPVTAVDRDRVEALVGGAALQRDHQRPNRAHRYVASGNDVSNAAKEALMELLLNPVVDPASSMNSEDPASITTATSAAAQQAKLRHPHLVSAHDYISTQLAALRFSVANGQRYHELFDLHAGAAAQQKSSSRTTHPNNNGNHQVDFIAENCRAVREQGPSTMCAEAYREHRLRLGRNQVTNTELSEWIHEQLESKRELMLLAAHSATTGTADLGDDSNNTPATLPPDSLNGTLNPGSSIVLASSPTANKNSPRNHSSNSSMVQSERDIANLSKRQWLALVAGGVRAAVFVKAAEALYQARVSNAIAKDLQRRRPPEQPPLVYLDLLRGKHDLVRRTLRKFIQNRLRAKHRHHVDLIIRYLKFRLLQQTITRRVQWYRRCVITCQRQVLTFLQMIRARKLLLHLQWIKKECALLKVPNKSVDELRSQWSEQKRTIDPALLCGTRLLQTGGGGGGSPTQHQGGRSPMSRDGRGRTPKTGAAAVAQHGGYMHVNQWRPPLLKPGVPPCVVWSTRMTWVPPGGTPYEARCSSIQTLCTSLVKQHAADLRSAEGTLRFFSKTVVSI